MNQTSQPSAAQKVNAIRDQLLQAYIQKEKAEQLVVAAERQILALSNALTGVGVGQQLQQEIVAEQNVPLLHDK